MKINFKIFILFLILIVLATSGFGCVKKITPVPVTLNWWGVWETTDDVSGLIAGFNALHPTITINYKKFRYEEYEGELLNALAEDRGPDLFTIPATWLKKYQTKLLPEPANLTLPYQEIKGTVKKETITTIKTLSALTPYQIDRQFVDVVGQDVVLNNQVYGLPLYMDTIVLYYNRDLLNNAGVATPPQNWSQFTEATKKLTLLNKDNQIIQAGAALGTSSNIPRGIDVLATLMMQNGSKMSADNGAVTFNLIPENASDKTYNPGLGALIFYTDFANQIKEVYSWNEEMPNALDAFASGKLAMFFGYSYHLPMIKNLAPKLNFSLVSMPQIEGSQTPVNFANYQTVTVSKKTTHPNEAWGFINYAVQKDANKNFLTKTKKATALKELIDGQLKDDQNSELKTFASQVLTAKSWYHGSDPLLAEKYFGEMIDNVVKGTQTPLEAINLAAQQINSTIQ